MDKSALDSATLTQQLFWYGILSTLLSAILSSLPLDFFMLSAAEFVLNSISFILILTGSILAYSYRKSATPPFTSHYQYLIRTLWLMVIFSLVMLIFSINDAANEVNNALSMASGKVMVQSAAPSTSLTALSNGLNVAMQVFLLLRMIKSRKLLRAEQAVSKPKTWWI